MPLPTQQQVSAAGRHVLTFSMGVVTAMAALHVISSGDAATISQAISGISSGVAAVVTAAAPLVAIVSGWLAVYKASRKSQVAAVAALPGVTVVAPPEIANGEQKDNRDVITPSQAVSRFTPPPFPATDRRV